MILAIDQGTSSTKACLFEASGDLLAKSSIPVKRFTASAGAVTQDPAELVDSCREAARTVLGKVGVKLSEVAGVALANQGESFLLLGSDGRPRTPVIGWQDVTGAVAVESLAGDTDSEWIRARTGLPLHAMFPGPKLAYHRGLLDDRNARFATLDTWLIHELDPHHPFVTDRATASRTMLTALDGDDWDEELLRCFGVAREMLAQIVPCDAPGAELVIDGESAPLWASGYDTGLALLGHGCFSAGELKASFGTCLDVMSATGETPIHDPALLTTIAYGQGPRNMFALSGEIAACGALVSWATSLGIARSTAELEELAASVEHSGGTVIVPAIQGLGAPHWRDDIRASIVGMTAASGRAQLARAVLDALAWSLADVIEAIVRTGVVVSELRVDGGLAGSDWLMQRCANVVGITLLRSDQREATAYGAATLAMLAHGLTTRQQVSEVTRHGTHFPPREAVAESERQRWRAALTDALAQQVEHH